MSCKILSVVGARPNFMKVAPVHRALLASDAGFESRIVHTGQHYDKKMSDIFFRQLGLPEPDLNLGIGSASHAVQTARIMEAFEPVLHTESPDIVLVVGDVNSTIACSLVAAKVGIPVAHVEAGLRSFDRRMPEEINRILTDRMSDFLFVSEESGLVNLRAEGVEECRIHFVGNVMIDSLLDCRNRASTRPILADFDLSEKEYVLMTIHRPSNVDDREPLRRVVEVMQGLSEMMPVVFPMHPRIRHSLEESDLWRRVQDMPDMKVCEPLGYLDFLHLMDHAAVVVTDSGGVQEETTYLGVPCLTVRENTERPSTVEIGTNELVPLDVGLISQRLTKILEAESYVGEIPPLWDGKASERIVGVFEESVKLTSQG